MKVADSHINLSVISSCLNHDTTFVYCCQQEIIAFVKSKLPLLKMIIYVSDDAAYHFKNKDNMMKLLFHKTDFNIEA